MSGTTVATTAGDRLRVSPVARRLADERQIDLSAVVGTGPNGAIVKRDVSLTAVSRTAEATLAIAARPATSITAQTDVDVARIVAASTDHPLAAFIIRALVDSLRHEAIDHPVLSTFVEPRVRYVRASTGQSAALPDAAGLRLSALTSRLDKFADDAAFDATVNILDSSDQSCAVSGAMSSAISVGIGPRQTKPTATTSGTGMAIVFSEVVDVSVTVDETLIPVQALTALTTHLKQVLETRDWSAEV
jgi:pyruvate dehydrogenase E2 component (dihydrolipoamide acetyltransferase)